MLCENAFEKFGHVLSFSVSEHFLKNFLEHIIADSRVRFWLREEWGVVWLHLAETVRRELVHMIDLKAWLRAEF